MRYTLLEMTQAILSAMESDEVNSINDTVESYSVALLLKYLYYDIYNDLKLIEHQTTFGLTASGDPDKPVLMTVPENVSKVLSIKYDCREDGDTLPDYREIVFKDIHEFIQDYNFLREEDDDVDSMTVDGDNSDEFTVIFKTNKAPEFYTFFDNNIILFDSIDTGIDTTLQQSKTLCLGHVFPEFTLEDDFIPDLDPTQFPYFLNRAKIRAFAELKQSAHQEANSEARRQKVVTQDRKNRIASRPNIYNAPRYGRK